MSYRFKRRRLEAGVNVKTCWCINRQSSIFLRAGFGSQPRLFCLYRYRTESRRYGNFHAVAESKNRYYRKSATEILGWYRSVTVRNQTDLCRPSLRLAASRVLRFSSARTGWAAAPRTRPRRRWVGHCKPAWRRECWHKPERGWWQTPIPKKKKKKRKREHGGHLEGRKLWACEFGRDGDGEVGVWSLRKMGRWLRW